MDRKVENVKVIRYTETAAEQLNIVDIDLLYQFKDIHKTLDYFCKVESIDIGDGTVKNTFNIDYYTNEKDVPYLSDEIQKKMNKEIDKMLEV